MTQQASTVPSSPFWRHSLADVILYVIGRMNSPSRYEAKSMNQFRVKINNELIYLTILAVLMIGVALLPVNALRIALGIPFLLFLPGYALVSALFTRREGLDIVERLALSFGLSIVIVPLLGLVLNYSAWGIRLESVLYAVVAFIVVASCIAWFRRRKLPASERFGIDFQIKMPRIAGSTRDKALIISLLAAIVIAVGSIIFVLAAPGVEEKFTEFYILGVDGRAGDFPAEVRVGEEAHVIVNIANREHATVSYRVEVRIDGVSHKTVEPIVLDNEEKWQETVGFTPAETGNDIKVEFLLYKNAETEPALQPLYLRINVVK